MDKRNIDRNFTAVILCAGRGTRIAKTTKLPKSLLKINGKSIIDRTLEALEKNQVKKVNIVTGYKASLLKKHVLKRDNKKISIKFIKNKNPIKYGNSYSLYLGIKNIKSDIIIMDGDLIVDQKIISKIYHSKKNILFVGKGNISDKECAKTLIDKNGNVKKTIDKRFLSNNEIKNYNFIGEAIGIIKISKENFLGFNNCCKKFLKNKKNLGLNWEHLINSYVVKNTLKFIKIKRLKWIEVDTTDDYCKAKKLFK